MEDGLFYHMVEVINCLYPKKLLEKVGKNIQCFDQNFWKQFKETFHQSSYKTCCDKMFGVLFAEFQGGGNLQDHVVIS